MINIHTCSVLIKKLTSLIKDNEANFDYILEFPYIRKFVTVYKPLLNQIHANVACLFVRVVFFFVFFIYKICIFLDIEVLEKLHN